MPRPDTSPNDVEAATGERGSPVLWKVSDGKEEDGKPSLDYLMPLRAGAQAHGLPE